MSMIPRLLHPFLRKVARQFPALWLTGPRQSGKTTLAKLAFPDFQYVSLEDLDKRAFAAEDPRGFIRQYPGKVIIDEAQKCPSLASYLQGHIDRQGGGGQYVLTGSHQFQLARQVSQSLAGRVAVATLLPFSLSELYRLTPVPADRPARPGERRLSGKVALEDVLFKGFYPAVHARKAEPGLWYTSYYATYLERDIKEITAVHDLGTFDKFVRLCAARTANLLNYSDIANACGVSMTAVKAWLSVLEMGGIVKLLQPYHASPTKRLVKTPKLYFLDTGLLCYLLRIREAGQLAAHPLKGAIFETLIIAEAMKSFHNRLEEPPLYFWRDSKGNEIDLLIDHGTYRWPIEIKSSETVSDSFFSRIRWWLDLYKNNAKGGTLVYGGDTDEPREPVNVRSWRTAL